ncbi:MAG TPA: hypothetical protein VEF04_02215, partial [Blastocatellia bacterium]|nr:hypothetical protein [Blastocatellia bacterium]
MANQGTQGSTQQQSNQGMGQTSGQSGQFPLDNLTYDLITVLYEKSKALEAYDKYMQDAQGHEQARQLFQELRQMDTQCVEKLRHHL